MGKFLETGIPDHLTYPLKNLYVGQEATARTGHETTDWFKFGKGVHQVVYCNPVYLSGQDWPQAGQDCHKEYQKP